MIPLLESAGHRVFSPTLTGHGEIKHLSNPGIGLETHVEDVVNLILAEGLTEVILVGHSYAGLVISSVVNKMPDRISELVYVDAIVPEDGESAVDVIPITQELIDNALLSGSGWRVPPPAEAPAPIGLFGITDPDDIAWVSSMLSDQPVRCFQEPARLDDPAASAVARTHIHCTVGRPEGVERRPVAPVQPNGSPSQVWELTTGHDCMITAPNELAKLLLKIATNV